MTTRPVFLRTMAFFVAVWIQVVNAFCMAYVPFPAWPHYAITIIATVNAAISGVLVSYALGLRMRRPFHQFDP
jgi:magnesium-transporting ATPase (P-type)